HTRPTRIARLKPRPAVLLLEAGERASRGRRQLSPRLARPERLELPTPRFEAWCSIQLSYGRTFIRRTGGHRDRNPSPRPSCRSRHILAPQAETLPSSPAQSWVHLWVHKGYTSADAAQ